ncbi:MAG: YfiR family protein [Porticoccaceae bacterium]|nr:YfiR family protein [Porticoccaceae bacterium]
MVKLSALCLVFGLSLTTAPSLAADFASHEIKAVFLFNFANFVRWPDDAFAEESSPFIFCASNPQSAIVKTLAQVIHGESQERHQLLLKAPFKSNELADCHLLFLEEADLAEYHSQLPSLSSGSLLTVSDSDNFADSGGLIQLVENKSRIQPLINSSQLERSKLTISSTLLRLAKIHRPPNNGDTP